MAYKILSTLFLLIILTACSGHSLVGGRLVPVFDTPSYQTDVTVHLLWGVEDSVFTTEGHCYIKSTRSVDLVGTSLWQCTEGIGTGEMFTSQELLGSELYHVVVNYTDKPIVLEPEIGSCDMDVGLFEANNCTPFGGMSPFEVLGLSQVLGSYVKIIAARPIDAEDWLGVNTLGHEFCHLACEDLLGKESPLPTFTNIEILNEK